jgi:hypothetical protein
LRAYGAAGGAHDAQQTWATALIFVLPVPSGWIAN